jgi:glucan endo-1,3-alpha-glucosidase
MFFHRSFVACSSLPCSGPNDAATLRQYITTYATHPNQLIYKGRVYASTFAGESCTFGQSSVAAGWSSQFIQQLTGANTVFFVPSFFVDPNTFSTFNGVMDGALNVRACALIFIQAVTNAIVKWNSAWPISLESSSGSSGSIVTQIVDAVANIVSGVLGGVDADTQYINGLNTMTNPSDKAYMPTVSPWFFTHYGADSFNKNVSMALKQSHQHTLITCPKFVYYADSHLYPVRWEQLISSRDKFDIIEIVTWNDYGESSYIGPIAGAQPNSQAWVDGFDHTAWLNMTAYYAEAFKTGVYPTIAEDKIYMWTRPHSKDADAPDSVGKPSNFDLVRELT